MCAGFDLDLARPGTVQVQVLRDRGEQEDAVSWIAPSLNGGGWRARQGGVGGKVIPQKVGRRPPAPAPSSSPRPGNTRRQARCGPRPRRELGVRNRLKQPEGRRVMDTPWQDSMSKSSI